ncbi:hypothetical protein GCM10010168_51150 [Actinoplanes ianthinogenes]|uniref:SnoaL-like domain-containing protein n=1 Tax=Actinoplanes ianthinogenes TaxID=122358 RepID=A0ABM7M3J8_9ACTN|nr:nuclear transport factor 2 family protein [Actinoplanes ianthinogenes]BCJ46166.1 hypothetical protein Aiant_68230 [Actinoplanes ianthinogenes]GGR26736.1 hypothetical protein GCM10010168_51150 [Actinoplanes ianthinogenes]
MSTQPSATALVAGFFQSFGAGDLPGLLALFADDVDFRVAGAPTVPWVGERRTRAEIEAFFKTLGAELTTEAFAVDAVFGDATNAGATGSFTQRVNSTGKAFTSDFALYVQANVGEIVKFRFFEDSFAVAEAF